MWLFSRWVPDVGFVTVAGLLNRLTYRVPLDDLAQLLELAGEYAQSMLMTLRR